MGMIVSGTGGPGETDGKFNVPVMIEVPHHEIHEGDMYVVHRAVNSAGFSLCGYIPAGTKRVHMLVQWAVAGAAELQIWEGRGWDAGSGSQVPIFNHDRNSSNMSFIQEDSTGVMVASGNVLLDPTDIGVGGNPAGVEIMHWETFTAKNQGSERRGDNEFILKNGTKYVVTFLSNAGAVGVDVLFHWYEHTDDF